MLITTTALLLAAIQASPAPDRVVIEPGELSVAVDSSVRVEATAYDANGAVVPARSVRWFSTDPEIVTVSTDGIVTAVRPGTVQIAALIRGKAGRTDVTVPQLPPARLELAIDDEEVRARTLARLRVSAYTRLGDVVEPQGVQFASSDLAVTHVDDDGILWTLAPGTARVRAFLGELSDEVTVRVVPNPAISYEINPTEAEVMTGDVARFRVVGRTEEGAEVTSFRPIWKVRGGSGAEVRAEGEDGVFVAEEPGRYTVTAQIGVEHQRIATIDVTPRKSSGKLSLVGRGPISTHHAADMWVFEGIDGRDYAYVGTFGHDWMMVFDVTDPSQPVLTDSVQVDARRINDVKIHPSNLIAIITREGASSRRNGIVLLDLSIPAHPTIMSEYTETVTGGVHNVWIRGEEELVYAAHNGTSEMHIIDISDPMAPREVGRWGLDKENKTLHDVIVQDGYAYLSYWDDGLIMLDVGAGTHGGSPTEPVFVSQFKYPIGNTHTAWRAGDYLFVGDEIFPSDWDPDQPIEASGYVHVIDYSKADDPREVARYEVPDAGAHNFWVEDDLLYVGYYQGGLRVVDVSGELRGDLYRQGRELAVLKTTDAQSLVPDWPMTFNAQPYKGNLFMSDFNSGLWIARFQLEPLVP